MALASNTWVIHAVRNKFGDSKYAFVKILHVSGRAIYMQKYNAKMKFKNLWSTARDGMWRRHGHLPGGDEHVHHSDTGTTRLSVGLSLPRRLRRGGPRPQVSLI